MSILKTIRKGSTLLVLSMCLGLIANGALAGAHSDGGSDGAMKDAWLDGKLETVYLLNTQLNSFTIDTEVKNGVAYLSGTVKSEIDKELADEIAQGIDGITSVKNSLKVKADVDTKGPKKGSDGRSFGQVIDDATTTATIKSELLGNSEVSGMKINVDTRDDVVTLSGTVKSEAQKQLAEQIAKNAKYVDDVNNNLSVNE